MKMTTIVCEECGKHVERPQKEVTRSLKLGRRFFCSNSCGAKKQPSRIPNVTKICPACGACFETREHGKRARLFCSPTCANSVPRIMSPEGLAKVRQTGLAHKGNLSVSSAMKSREAWKYVELEKSLSLVPHEFECEIGNYIFDLVLPHLMVAVEFDGPDHKIEKQKLEDAKKTLTAENLGYTVVRKAVKRATVIPAAVLDGVL